MIRRLPLMVKRAVGIVTVLVFFLTNTIVFLAPSTAQAEPTPELEQALAHYSMGNYGLSLESLDGLLQDAALVGTDRRDAHLLRGRCLVRLGRDDDAVAAFCEALRLDREYRPTTWELDENASFDNARGECVGGDGIKWWQIVGGAVVVGVAAWLLWPEDKDILPAPPDPPVASRQFLSWEVTP